MEGQRRRGRTSAPPRIPADIRKSAVENHLAKSRASGSYRLRRATGRRRGASYDSLPKREQYNSCPPSAARSARSDMGNGVPSAGVDVNSPARSTTTRAQPKTTKEIRTEVGEDRNERARAAAAAARANRAAIAVAERQTKNAKLRLEELRKRSGNRYSKPRGIKGGAGRRTDRGGGVRASLSSVYFGYYVTWRTNTMGQAW